MRVRSGHGNFETAVLWIHLDSFYSIIEFYKLFWGSRTFFDKFAAKLQYYDTSATDWKQTQPVGCFERKVRLIFLNQPSWIMR